MSGNKQKQKEIEEFKKFILLFKDDPMQMISLLPLKPHFVLNRNRYIGKGRPKKSDYDWVNWFKKLRSPKSRRTYYQS